MILLLDNRDSFVHNLARYVRELGGEATVLRSDRVRLGDALALEPTHLIVSPGPRGPADAGISTAAVGAFAGRIPVLGVCLGHLCVSAAFGGTHDYAARPMHGRASPVFHEGGPLFHDVPSPFLAARYHSLCLARETLPREFEVTAWTEEAEVMAVAHRDVDVFGIQFHPESILSEHGHRILENFLGLGTGAPVRDGASRNLLREAR